jgi:Ca-activated chloride channel family protein
LFVVTSAVLATGAADTQTPPAADSAEAAVARGAHAYDDGRFDAALTAFQSAINCAPHLAVPRYNAAATLFQLKQYARAWELYQEARQHANAALRTKIDYALGNTALALGELAAAIRAYDDCLASTAGGARLDQVRSDAAINRKFAIEQAESPAIVDNENPDDPSRSPRRNGRRGTDPREDGGDNSPGSQTDSGSGDAGSSPDGGDQEKPNRPPNRRRRTGGAGGSGRGPQGSLGDSPDDRLDAALEHIRQAAESRRLPEEPPPDSPATEGKDW